MATVRLRANVIVKSGLEADLPGLALQGEILFAEDSKKLFVGSGSGIDEVITTNITSWDDLTNKPVTFPPSAHTHTESEVTGLTSDLSTLASAITSEASTRAAADITEAAARDAAIAVLGALLLEGTAVLEFDSIESRKTITADGNYNGSVSVVSKGGSNLLLSYIKGTNHTAHTDVGYKTSADSGATWGSESLLTPYYSGAFKWNNHRMPGGTIVSSGSLDSGDGPGYVYSIDNGANWSSPVSFETVFTTRGFKIGTDAYLAAYKSSLVSTGQGAFLYKSIDDGLTWTKISEIRKVGEPELTETGICYLGSNRILAISRDGSETNTYLHTSDDLGATWNAVVDVTSTFGVLSLPQLMNLGDVLLLVARQYDSSQLVMYLSHDRGTTWSPKIVLDSYTTSAIDGGYSWPLVLDSTHILVPYYASATVAGKPDIKSLVLKFRGGTITDVAI